jgi:hypothetical protein
MAGLDLTGNQVSTTYKSLIKTSNNTPLPASGKTRLTDGEGNDTSISLGQSNAGLKVFGSLEATGDTSSVNFNASGDIAASGCVTATCADITGNITASGSFVADSATITNGVTASSITASGNICAGGTIRATGDVIAYYSSDKRLKDNINKICNTQNIINNITGYTFDWNKNAEQEGVDIGVIAQEVQKVLPTVVKERDNGYLAVDYIKLIPVLIEEVKRLNSEINELKNKIK